jgi:hypothetical protein
MNFLLVDNYFSAKVVGRRLQIGNEQMNLRLKEIHRLRV